MFKPISQFFFRLIVFFAGIFLTVDLGAQPLSGSFTVGTGGTYATLQAAVTDVTTRGVNGPLTFRLRNGTFNEQVTMGGISGVSATNTVTFESESGNAANVILTFNATTTATNYIIRLDNANFIRFRNLTFQPTGATANRAIHGINNLNDITFENLVFNLPATTSFSEDRAAILFRPTLSSNIRFINNTITGGSHGIMHIGNNSARSPGTVFTGNTITNVYTRAAFFQYMQGGVFNNNTISGSNYGDYYGLGIYDTSGYLEVLRNRITGSFGHAFKMQFCIGTDAQRSLIANNFFHSNSNYATIYTYSVSYTNFYHNSVNNTSTGSAFDFDRWASDFNKIVNNNFRANDGFAINYGNPSDLNAIEEANYNNLFTSGSFIARNGSTSYGTRAEWQAATGYDANSVTFDPQYASDTNLNASAPGTASGGKNLLSVVPADINSVARTASPSFGATQYSAAALTPLSGTYTIGTGQTYTTINAAINAMKVNGINGAVTFQLASQTFTEQFILPSISGSSATNTVTFQAQSGNASDVILTFAATTSPTNYIALLSNASFVTFKNLTLQPTGASFNRAIYIDNRADDITFENLIITLPATTSFSEERGAIIARPSISTNIRFINNTITGGSHGILHIGNNSARSPGTVFTGNTITNVYTRPAFFQYLQGGVFNNNTISGSNYGDYYGLGIYDTSGYLEVLRNRITGSVGHALKMQFCVGIDAQRSLIANNFLHSASPSSYSVIYFYGVSYAQLYHNSVNATGNGTALGFDRWAADFNRIVNNNFKANTGYAVDFGNPSDLNAIEEANYNNLFTSGSFIARNGNTNYGNIADWRTATNYDLNSLTFDPQYLSTTDLHASAPGIAAAGKNINNEVPDDIDGIARPSTPSIGANQFGTSGTPLNGEYTINASGSGTTNFTSITTALDALKNFGVSAPVVFKLTGEFNEQVTLLAVSGSSVTNTITFESAGGQPADATIRFASTTGGSNFTLRLSNADHYRIRNLTIKAEGTTFGRAIHMINRTINIVLEGNIIESVVTTATSADRAGVIIASAQAENVQLLNNLIRFGAVGIDFQGPTSKATGTVLQGNTIFQSYYRGISLNYHAGFVLDKNIVTNNPSAANFEGMMIHNVDGAFQVTANKVTGGNGTALNMYAALATAGNPALVANNFFQTVNNAGYHTVYLNFMQHVNFYHNNINATGNGSGLFYTSPGTSLNFLNNNIKSNDYTIQVVSVSAIGQLDYNNYYTTGTTLARWNNVDQTNLAALQTATGQNTNSLSVDPLYQSSSDLEALASSLAGAGLDLTALVPTDINGNLRSTPVSIGATQFTAAFSKDGALTNIITPTNSCTLTATTEIKVEITNLGAASITGFQVAYQIDGGVPVVEPLPGTVTIPPGGKYEYAFTQKADLAAKQAYTIKAYIVLTDDENTANDQLEATITHFPDLITTLTSNVTICKGTSQTLTATGGTQYLWNTGATSAFITVSPTVTTTYDVLITNVNGCSETKSVVVTVKEIPLLGFTNDTGFTAAFVNPLQGGSDEVFEFRMVYTDANGNLPAPGYPRVELDANSNGQATDPLDLIRVMTQADPGDTDVTDGKEYRVSITNLSDQITWRSRIVANSTDGCSASSSFVAQPFVSNDLLDVAIFANDISFSKSNPAINEPIKIYARIRNTSDFLAENFIVSAYIEDVKVFTQTVSQINPQSSITLQWDQSFIASGFYPVKVVLDETNVLNEDNELNNFAIRPILVGDYVLPGGIEVGATAIAPVSLQAGQLITISGQAQYFGIDPGVDPDVAGATVIARITGGNQAQTTTQADGTYQLSVYAPAVAGTYQLTIEVTDYTLTGYQGPITITVLPAPPLPDLTTSISLSKNTILPGEPVTGTATISNVGELVATNFVFRYFSCEQVLGEHTIASLAPGESLTYTFDAVTSNIGDCFNANSCSFQSSADVNNQVIEKSKINNVAAASLRVLPNKPDLTPINSTNQGIPGSTNMLNPFTFSVRVDNIGGVNAVDAFNVNVYVDGVLIATQAVPSLNTCAGQTFQVTHTFADLNDHIIAIRVDEPLGSGSVDEYRETNNEFSKTVRHQPPPPQYPNLNVQFQDISITPVLPPAGSNFDLQVNYRNNGPVLLNAPFNLELIVIEAGITRSEIRTINSNMAPGDVLSTTLTTNLQSDGDHLFRIKLDPENAKTESTKSDNVTQIPLCVDLQVNPVGGVWSGNFYVNTVQNLTASISNLGIFSANNVPVSFFIDNVKIASTTLPSLGPVNGANSQSVSIPHLFNQVGTFELKVVVDELNAYNECRENNNEYKTNITVRVPAPDLRIVSEYISPSKINPDVNEPITIFLSYDNIGIGATGSFKARVLVDDVPIGPDVTIASVPAGEDGTVEVPTSYQSATAGIRVIRTILDPDDELSETSKSNNEATRALVVGQAPNLFFTNLESSIACPNDGDDILLTASIMNGGDLEATASVHFFYITTNDTIPLDIKTITIAGKGSITVQTDWLVLDKTYQLYAEIRDSAPEEFDKSDNTITTRLCGGPYYNLVVVAEGQGIIQKTPNQQRYEGVQQVEVTAVPAAGWIFSGWQGDILSTDNPLIINLASDQNISAIFSELLNPPVVTNAQRCATGVVTLQASGAAPTQTYAWYATPTGGIALQNNASDSFITPILTVTTSFYVSIKSFTGESPRIEVTATLLPLPAQPLITITGETTICPEKSESVNLSAPVGFSQYLWSTSETTEQITVTQAGSFTVQVSDVNGCQSLPSAAVTINTKTCSELIIYNGISADGDEVNKYFRIENIDFAPETRNNTLKIFNRWGDLVFEAKDYDNVTNQFTGIGKNGKELPSGTYFYQLEFPERNDNKIVSGYLQLKK